MQVSHGAIQFMVYEDLKERTTRPASGAQRAPPSSAEITAMGAASKLAASIATYPSQARPARAAARGRHPLPCMPSCSLGCLFICLELLVLLSWQGMLQAQPSLLWGTSAQLSHSTRVGTW